MSTELHQRSQAAGIATLIETEADNTALQIENTKRLIHYLWFPYVDIPLTKGDGLRLRLGKGNQFYGMGRPGEDYGFATGRRTSKTPFAMPRPADSKAAETAHDYETRMAGWLMRCTAYPIWNITYRESRFQHGNFTDVEWNAGNTLEQDTDASQEDVTVTAGVCAADFMLRYEVTHGARVLTPLIGMDDSEIATATELVKLVQPYTYKLTNYRQEIELGTVEDEETLLFDLSDNGPADQRIRGARLDKVLEPKAHELRRIMLGGVRQALVEARATWEDLMNQLSNSAQGHKGHKKQTSHYDKQVAWLLGMNPPAGVATLPPGPDRTLEKAVTLLTEQAIARNVPASDDAITIRESELDALIERKVAERMGRDRKGKAKEGDTA